MVRRCPECGSRIRWIKELKVHKCLGCGKTFEKLPREKRYKDPPPPPKPTPSRESISTPTPPTFNCKNCNSPITAYPCPVCKYNPRPSISTRIKGEILGKEKEAGYQLAVALPIFLITFTYIWFVFYGMLSSIISLLFKAIPAGYILAGPVSLVIAIVLPLYVGLKLSRLGFVGGLTVMIIGIAIVHILYTIITPIFLPGGMFGKEAEFFSCLLETGFDFQQCQFVTTSTREIPTAQKIGPKEIISLSFGAPEIPFPIIRYNETYEFPVTITGYTKKPILVTALNFSDDEEISIENETGENIPLDVKPKFVEVSEDFPAIITYYTKEKILKKEGSYVSLIVKAKYNYNTSGTNDFILAREKTFIPREIEDCVNPLLRRPLGKPCSWEGPLDIIIYFTPSPFYYPGKKEFKMFITIENKGDGYARLAKVEINNLTPVKEISQFWENEECKNKIKEIKGIGLPEGESVTISCSFKVEKPEVPSLQVKFQARVEYEYTKSIRKEIRIFPQLK